MYTNKHVLLIGGGGSLGLYAAQELVRKGCYVDVLCQEDHKNQDRLQFFIADANLEHLQEFMAGKHYDGIINFLHYRDMENYKNVHQFLSANTDHLIFLSSYRVYADLQHPITEDAPRLLDVIKDDPEFLEKEDYALAKARAEDYIRNESGTTNWTLVRPVISTSFRRFDLVNISGTRLLRWTAEGKVIPLPEKARDLIAAVDWAGNTGKLIANLLFKKDAYGEAFTVSSCQNLSWGQVAEYYEELIGARFQWVSTEAYLDQLEPGQLWSLIYDRLYDRPIDNSKILRVTGLTQADFKPMKEGIQIELKKREEMQ